MSLTLPCCCRYWPVTIRACTLSVEGSGTRFLADPKADFKGRRIGWLGDLDRRQRLMSPGVLDVCRAVRKTFESLGCTVDCGHAGC